MSAESTIDEKGRVCIPAELRKKLNLKTGEKIVFQLNLDSIILRKATTPEEFSKQVHIFQESVKKSTSKPITFEKLLE